MFRFAGITACATVFLVIVGGLGVWAALRTLRAIERQADAMAVQTALLGPRLHTERVSVSDFEIGKQPWFFIEIMNSGPKAAEGVIINMRIESGLSTGTVGAKWTKEQTVTIPANSSRQYFIKWAETLSEDAYRGFQMVVPLRVRGYYQIGDTKVDYCYKYLPCDDARPDRVPEFIPCDFEPGLTVMMSANIQGKARVVGSPTDANAQRPPEPMAN